MNLEPASENPYQPPQADIQTARVVPVIQPLTQETNAKFFIACVTACLSLFVLDALFIGSLKPRFFEHHYGRFSWERILGYALQGGGIYGVIFAGCMLGSVTYLSKGRVNLAALWKYYKCMVAIMLGSWLSGGMFGLAAHELGWAAAIPDISKFDRAIMLLKESRLSAWFFGAQSLAIAFGTIGLILLPILFTIRHRVRDQPRECD